jgi:hypothetical protein
MTTHLFFKSKQLNFANQTHDLKVKNQKKHTHTHTSVTLQEITTPSSQIAQNLQ